LILVTEPGPVLSASTAWTGRQGVTFTQVAEADGNRTRQRRSAALTSFEDWGDHQVPRRLRVDSTECCGRISAGDTRAAPRHSVP
jgi:hypothetical protein